MEGSDHRSQDSSSAEKLPSLSFYDRTKSAYSTAKAADFVDNDQPTMLEHYPQRPWTRSATRAACLDGSGGDQGNAVRVNGAKLINHVRKSHTRSSSKRESLQALSKVDNCEILNGLSVTTVLSALEPVELDSSVNSFGKSIMETNDRLELMETVHCSSVKEPSSTIGRISFQTRSSSVKILASTHVKEEKPDESLNKIHNGRNGKRCRKEEEEEDEEDELKSTGKNKECNVRNLWNLDKVRRALNHEEDASRKKVKQALHVFYTIYNKLLQETETELKSKSEYRRNRLDLMALKMFREINVELKFVSPCIGSVPGVEVGDEFHQRVELCMLSLHRQLQAGVDYCKQDGRLIARSIISSDSSKYSNNGQISDVLIYSGSGAPDKNQKLDHGNLALKNSVDAQNLIRVIRGFEDIKICNSKSLKGRKAIRYIYDGLYVAEKLWIDKNDKGFDMFMFQLRRQKQQPEFKLKKVKLRTSISFSDICVEDISNGKEKVPICAVNTIDKESPEPFTYVKDIIYPSKYTPIPPKGCACSGACADSIKCACAVKNGGELPFNGRGAIVQAKPLVFECGPSCKCSPTCHNRVSQRGIKYPLEVFKTESMGWGLRSLSFITSGSFVCEYVGELIQDDDAQKRTNDEYLFAIGNNYHDAALWEGLPTSIPELQKCSSSELDDEMSYTVDASIYGNVARFINHSCMPNLYAQNLLFDHGNKSMPHIMLFASEDIPPLQELTYHYNYTLGQVHDSNGNIKQKVCHCGTVECTGRLY